MHFTTAAISLLSLTFGASAAAVPLGLEKRDSDSGFWQLVAKPPNDSTATGVPVILGAPYDNDANTFLSTGASGETLLCIELTLVADWSGPDLAGAKVINHPGATGDIWMWKTIGAKQLYTSVWMDITGTRGNWSFVQDPNSSDMLLALDGDTAAKYVVYNPPDVPATESMVLFGSDIPTGEGGTPIVLVGVSVESC